MHFYFMRYPGLAACDPDGLWGRRLTGVAADGGGKECAQAFASLVSGAQFCWIHRS
jgi:hypothetical protein